MPNLNTEGKTVTDRQKKSQKARERETERKRKRWRNRLRDTERERDVKSMATAKHWVNLGHKNMKPHQNLPPGYFKCHCFALKV